MSSARRDALRVETSDGKVDEVTEVFATDVHLDLAHLRIARSDLKPLPLGDSDKLRQGDRIVAMGNPEGLAYSVVEGVISEPQRDIDGLPMIQVALPIERGNSGGPLLDRQGRVLGLLTLKSARTDNLGFAMPVNDLKKLLEKPNPVPMSRWLTIGVLNPRVWKPLMGAQWTQRAGVVSVEQPGEWFRRALACACGSRKSRARNLRPKSPCGSTTRRALPGWRSARTAATGTTDSIPRAENCASRVSTAADVFTWKILADAASDAYRPGEWNTLRVHVDANRASSAS